MNTTNNSIITHLIIDFDGIFSKYTTFAEQHTSRGTRVSKFSKSYQLAARHHIKELHKADPNLQIIFMSGDMRGRNITSKMLEDFDANVMFIDNSNKIATMQKIAEEDGCTLSQIAFVGDDFYDLGVSAHGIRFITHCNAVESLKQSATYVSSQTPDYYLIADVCEWVARQNCIQLHSNSAKAQHEWLFNNDNVVIDCSRLSETTGRQLLLQYKFELKTVRQLQASAPVIEAVEHLSEISANLASSNSYRLFFYNKYMTDQELSTFIQTLAFFESVAIKQPALIYKTMFAPLHNAEFEDFDHENVLMNEKFICAISKFYNVAQQQLLRKLSINALSPSVVTYH